MQGFIETKAEEATFGPLGSASPFIPARSCRFHASSIFSDPPCATFSTPSAVTDFWSNSIANTPTRYRSTHILASKDRSRLSLVAQPILSNQVPISKRVSKARVRLSLKGDRKSSSRERVMKLDITLLG